VLSVDDGGLVLEGSKSLGGGEGGRTHLHSGIAAVEGGQREEGNRERGWEGEWEGRRARSKVWALPFLGPRLPRFKPHTLLSVRRFVR